MDTGPQIRKELCDRYHESVMEAEAAFWRTLKEKFPEAHKGELPPSLLATLYSCLEGTARAWAIENVPGMVDALALERMDLQTLAAEPPYDDRDQT